LATLVELVRAQPPRPPRPVDADDIARVLDEHANAFRMLQGRRDLTGGERGALQADLIGELQHRTGLVLLEGRRQTVKSGWHDASALEAGWLNLTVAQRRAVVATHFHYIVIQPAPRRGPRFQPARVEFVQWSPTETAGARLRRIASGWTPVTAKRAVRPQKDQRRWSDDDLVAALRAWVQSTGHVSSAAYLNDQRINPQLPSLATMCRRFGGWQPALARAGHTREPKVTRRYTEAQLRDALRAWMDAGGDRRSASYNRAAAATELPAYATVVARFGSWRAALAAIDEDTPGRRWTHDEVVVAVSRWVDRNRQRASSAAYARAATRNPDLPCLATVMAKLGSWPNVVELTRPRPQRSVGVGSG
jgi:hypothetical protein